MQKSVQHHIVTVVTPSKERAAGLNAFDGNKNYLPRSDVKPRYMGRQARGFVTITTPILAPNLYYHAVNTYRNKNTADVSNTKNVV
jgi:hypothetical protein